MIDFLAIARHCLQPLADRGFNFRSEQLCRGEVRLECERGDILVRVSYEPFGPPWCDIREAGRLWRRLEVNKTRFTTSTPLARTPPPFHFRQDLLRIHEDEVETWCLRLLCILEDEKIAA
jgi:hypothetical protein